MVLGLQEAEVERRCCLQTTHREGEKEMGQQLHHDMLGHFLYPGCRFLSLTLHEGPQLEFQLPFKSSCIILSHSLSLFAMSKQSLFSGRPSLTPWLLLPLLFLTMD